ncbi:PEGA domain-containing protein [Candidatus Falkowbacteria bacterium]|nr:PEGA domain-containing protein [Candidatus Falkowbacteria bacterium]
MNLTIRRLIALGFIIIFVLVAPALILYTAGYRYNLKKQEIQKTGALVIKSQPANALISIDEKLISDKTPARINNVLPGEHLISLTKINYYPWSKKLIVKEQETSFVEDIVLLKKSASELLEEQLIKWTNFSSNNRFAVFIINDKAQDYLYLLNLDSQKIRLIYNNGKKFDAPAAQWSKDGAFVLFEDGAREVILSTSLPKQELEAPAEPAKTTNFQWADDIGNRLFFSSANDVFQFDVSTNTRQKIYSLAKTEKLLDYLIRGNRIYTISELKGKFLLCRDAISNAEDIVPRTIELSGGQFAFDGAIDDQPIVRDLTNNDFYIFDANLFKILFKKSGVNNVEYLKNKRLLLTQTEQEIGVIKTDDDSFEEENVTRYSRGLERVKWHYLANYVFALHEGKIDFIELDDRGGHFILSLPLENISDFGIDEKSKYLFFIQNGLLSQMLIK